MGPVELDAAMVIFVYVIHVSLIFFFLKHTKKLKFAGMNPMKKLVGLIHDLVCFFIMLFQLLLLLYYIVVMLFRLCFNYVVKVVAVELCCRCCGDIESVW